MPQKQVSRALEHQIVRSYVSRSLDRSAARSFGCAPQSFDPLLEHWGLLEMILERMSNVKDWTENNVWGATNVHDRSFTLGWYLQDILETVWKASGKRLTLV